MITTSPAMERSRTQPPTNRRQPPTGVFPPSSKAKDERIVIEDRPAPIDMRFAIWLDYQISTPRRFVRATLATYRFFTRHYSRGRRFLFAVLGPRISGTEYGERNAICDECEHLADRRGPILAWLRLVGTYCDACDCPTWWPAKLRVKNRWRNWRCPQRRHPGAYPSYKCLGCGGWEKTITGVRTNGRR